MATPSLATNANKFGDLKRRIWFLIGALIVYRIGAHIPVPGISPVELAKLFQSSQTGLLDMFNMFSGGFVAVYGICHWYYAVHLGLHYFTAGF